MKKKIVLIEDELILIKTYKLAFEEAGYEVKVVEKAEKALKTVQIEKPNLIVLDLVFYNSHGQLSKEVGLTVLTTLHNHPETKDIPVIIFTNLSENDKDRAIKLGAKAYITKLDATPKDVIREVEKWIK